MQHIVVMTARPEGLKSTDWITNGVGRKGQSLTKLFIQFNKVRNSRHNAK